ncbi:MAG: hypothetical protein J6Y37_18275 [Paludibacteraceae bacterium]|nr:hypothetical protein [Paludibacteraceae bacterium]
MMLKRLLRFGGENDFGFLGNLIVSVVGFMLIISAWHVEAVYGLIPTNILPDPFNVVRSYVPLLNDYNMIPNAWFSIKMNLLCYVYAIALSLPIGFVITVYPIFNILIAKYTTVIRFLPLPAITGIFVAIFGLTFNMKVWFLTIALMVYIIPTVVNKINDLQNPRNDKDNVYLQTITTLGATNWQKFRYVYFPYVTAGVADTCKDLLAVSWTYVTICELIYKDGDVIGIGALINAMVRQAKMPEVYALLLVVLLIGFMQDIIFGKLIKKLFPYRSSET